MIYPLDSAPFFTHSLRDVLLTIIEAIDLVFLVTLLFLQNVRATLVPTIAVPVVLLGASAVLEAFGSSLNTPTMFGGGPRARQCYGFDFGLAARDPALAQVRPNALPDAPQYRISIDREKASALGVSLADINDTMQSAWGSTYIGNFLDQGCIKRVYIQGDAASRMLSQDLEACAGLSFSSYVLDLFGRERSLTPEASR